MARKFQRRHLAVVFGSLAGYLLIDTLSNGVLVFERIGIALAPSAGLAIPLGVLFGVPAAVGVAVGALLRDTAYFSFSTLFYSISIFLLAYVARAFYRYGIGARIASDGGPARSVARFAFVAIIACSGSAAFLAFGYQMIGASPFYISVTYAFVEYLLATVVVAPVIGLPIAYSQRLSTYTLPRNDEVPAPSRINRWSLILVPPLWALIGFVGSLGFKFRERGSLDDFRDLNMEFLYHYVHPDIFGQGGRRAQVVLGVLLMVVLFGSMRRFQNSVEGDG